jgi:pimeloyl-ACP methyl ester carboxylesterase
MHGEHSRVIRGLSSLVTGFAFPLGSRWLRELDELRSEGRRREGSLFVLPGIEGSGPLNHNLARGLAEGGLACSIEIFEWTTGYWPLFAYHLRHAARMARAAACLADRLVSYQSAHPGRPTVLVGHSGGGALAIKTLECLPPTRSVTAVYLLAPAISRGYDLSRALSHVDAGIWNFYSPLDCFLLTLGAGSWGFQPPSCLDEEQRHHYEALLRQYRYHPRLARFWNLGGHFGWTNRVFVSEWLTPLISSTLAIKS